MKRRSKAGGKSVKARRRKTAAPKRDNAAKAVRSRRPSIADLQEQLDRRTRERDEALEQQTATADVLKVISRSTFDLQVVFDSLVQSAVRLCDAECAHIFRFTDNVYYLAACCGYSREYEEYMHRQRILPGRHSLIGRIALAGRMVHIPDALADPEYQWEEAQKLGRFRTMLGVPLLREGTPIGALSITRSMVRPFTAKQIELLTTFADQAVIAIENVRLFEAEQQRTRELTESLEQQTATSEVLQVISSSPGDLKPVFATMLDNAVRICDATFGGVYRFDGDIVRLVATHNLPPAFAEVARVAPFRPSPKSFIGRIAASKTLVHLEDAAASQPYVERDPATVAAVERGGTRAFLAVPMLKENALIGLLYLCRQQVRPYTDKQIELVQGFANQAVIAIENTRLLNELRESLEQQKASADILSVISNSVTDTQPVFDKILESCKHLFGGDELDVLLVDEQGQLNIAAYIGEAHDVVAATFPAPLERTPAGRAIRERRVMHWPDLVDGEDVPGVLRKMAKLIGYRSMVFAPMLWEGRGIGAIGVARSTGPFKPKELAMLQTFADQAVIAIQNASMFEQVQERTRELSASLDDLRTAQDRLVQTEKLASLGQLTAGIAHEIKNPLNFVNNFSSVSVELIDELREALGGVHLDDKRRTEINEIANMLQGNLDKVVQHGKRADAIVKNMLLHSRQGSGESIARSISTRWSMRASISPIMGRGPRSRASISRLRGRLTRPPARSICSRRR